jgi:hypothetical protein
LSHGGVHLFLIRAYVEADPDVCRVQVCREAE